LKQFPLPQNHNLRPTLLRAHSKSMINDNTGKMATELPVTGNSATYNASSSGESSFTVKTGLARMLQGGVIMDVVNAEQVRTYQLEMLHIFFLTHNTGTHCRGSWSLCRYGSGACPRRYQGRGRCFKNVRPQDDQGDHGGCYHSRHGKGSNWALRRMSGMLTYCQELLIKP
jgi:hypothetical protein